MRKGCFLQGNKGPGPSLRQVEAVALGGELVVMGFPPPSVTWFKKKMGVGAGRSREERKSGPLFLLELREQEVAAALVSYRMQCGSY